ncbi:hypothetical protein B0T21DRAFT_357952 [Apiosordaria backusii]|uniref:Uncharacterized protein n=1 Tax=Apiosordaria backusii TaxID=314023 RepID=A0AA40ES75_9PEZI|nr:hypothetical protein B0T21DRAFT_357952 [Apiosordaria backusii]
MVVLDSGSNVCPAEKEETSLNRKPKTNHRANRRRVKQREARQSWRKSAREDSERSVALWAWVTSLAASNEGRLITSASEPDDKGDNVPLKSKRYRPGPNERSVKFCFRMSIGNVPWIHPSRDPASKLHNDYRVLAAGTHGLTLEDLGRLEEKLTHQLKVVEIHLRRLTELCESFAGSLAKFYADFKTGIVYDSEPLRQGIPELSDLVLQLEQRRAILKEEMKRLKISREWRDGDQEREPILPTGAYYLCDEDYLEERTPNRGSVPQQAPLSYYGEGITVWPDSTFQPDTFFIYVEQEE